ncbi:PilN domain-containing protein [Methylomicrobium sp. RS1]|jgi:type IV pilus assembly protein PilN|uniref:PilN domain-containing protein n=1 Tax=Candidatus Methylomicrobium oryzae TaxID=2802053 RepID=UPI001922A5E8|nr:PilN domain-containing protein [Methylomicrobium sp. RS1]MBL1264336.1 PilN domain-containing protein [Methylomicrobium sp. RS1]
MAKINLLPWREELRKQKLKDFIAAIGVSVLLTIGLIVAVHIYIEGLKEYQSQRNQLLETEIRLLDVQIAKIRDIEETKRKLLAKIDVIQKLQESRPEIVHLFDEIPKVTPDGIYLTKLTQIGSALTFNGKTQSNARVSAFMRAIEASKWMNSPKVVVIQSPDKKEVEHASDFTMTANQGAKSAEKPL